MKFLEYDMLELENLSNFTVEELTFTVNGSSGNNIAWNTQKVEKFVKIFKGVKSLRIIDEIFTSNGASNYNLNFDSLKNLQDIEIIFNGSEEFFNSVSLSKLTKFTLESDTEYSATGIKDFVKRNPNIKRLKVDSLQMLLICMKRMKNLEVVTIDNEDYWLLVNRERELLQLLRQTQTLKELHLEKLEDGADFIESFYKERLPIKLFHN